MSLKCPRVALVLSCACPWVCTKSFWCPCYDLYHADGFWLDFGKSTKRLPFILIKSSVYVWRWWTFIRPRNKIFRARRGRKRHWTVSSRSFIFLLFLQVMILSSVFSIFLLEWFFWENHAIHLYLDSSFPLLIDIACERQAVLRVVLQKGSKLIKSKSSLKRGGATGLLGS